MRRALALAAALLGLLLMHGVGGHSAHAAEVHGDGHPPASMTHLLHDGVPAASTPTRATHQQAGAAAHEGHSSGGAADSASPPPREISEALMALCLTVLLAVAGLLLLAGHGQRLSPLPPLRRLRSAPTTAVRARPPDLHALSVLRC